MGRELRRVSADYEHPKDNEGNFIPLHKNFPYNAAEIEEGLRDGWLKEGQPYYGLRIMPQWPDEERTHFQMYETEGIPISPVMETPEALAHWLADNDVSAFGGMTATYDQWLTTIRIGHSFGLLLHRGVLKSGVDTNGNLT